MPRLKRAQTDKLGLWAPDSDCVPPTPPPRRARRPLTPWLVAKKAEETPERQLERAQKEAQAALDRQLCEAARDGDAAAIERLAGEGANPEAKDVGGVWVGIPAVWRLTKGTRRVPVVEAALKGHTAAVEALLRLGVGSKRSALRAAAGKGHAGAVVALLQGGAAVDAATKGGWTALMEAAANGHAEIVRLLLEAGADATLPCPGGPWRTALELVEIKGNTKVVALLEARLSADEKLQWATTKAEIAGYCSWCLKYGEGCRCMQN
eukprot:COSAG04_NODE_5023_length_1777_cov_73.545309_1_plen_265_part_00